MVSAVRFLACAAVLLAWPGAASAADQPCTDLLPRAGAPSLARVLAPEDLARLRDIGPVDTSSIDARLFTLSPDGKRIAFQLRRADPARNAYCLAMVVLDLAPGAQPHIVDSGGEVVWVHYDSRGRADVPTGIARPVAPRWSPDGRAILFLKRTGGRTQVWRAMLDGSGSAPLTATEADVEDFRLGADGRTLIYSSRPALEAARAAIEREGLSGFHYDDRYTPAISDRPWPAAPVPRIVLAQDLASGAVRGATPAEAALLPAAPILEVAWGEARHSDGRRAWLHLPAATFFPSRGRLMAEDARGTPVRCADEACAEAHRPWWTNDGRVRFFRREGWAEGSTAIYEWTPGPHAPRRLYTTDDVLADCAPDGDALLCLREGSLTPRRLERLDPATGHRRLVFDPNPEFSHLQLGRAERLHLVNAVGRPSIADLVLPVGYRRGTRYPLIVVQYDTRGFLRGGTGDDYPIQAFANRGYAVLSVSRPRMPALRSDSADVVALERSNLAQFDHLRSASSSIEAGVRLAVERGIADPERIGLTGMSDGATIAAFALLHSDRFAAAAMSQCCFDETFPARVGPRAARYFNSTGYPRITDGNDTFWDQLSLVRNARRVHSPILLQVADEEYMSALVTHTALREVGAPIDMYVFPNEHHVKWQPAHRLAIYRRSLDWFDYWLKGVRSTAPERQDEISHWETLRRSAPKRSP